MLTTGHDPGAQEAEGRSPHSWPVHGSCLLHRLMGTECSTSWPSTAEAGDIDHDTVVKRA